MIASLGNRPDLPVLARICFFCDSKMRRQSHPVILPLDMVDKSISLLQANFGLDLVFEQSSQATFSRGEAPSECFCCHLP